MALAVRSRGAYNQPMRLRRLSFLITFLAALVLPFQAMAGLVMAAEMASGDGVMVAAVDDAMAAMPDDCPMHQQQSAPDTARCGHCGICHMAATGFIYSAHAHSMGLPVSESYAAVLEAAPSSHIPEPPQHPPKRSV